MPRQDRQDTQCQPQTKICRTPKRRNETLSCGTPRCPRPRQKLSWPGGSTARCSTACFQGFKPFRASEAREGCLFNALFSERLEGLELRRRPWSLKGYNAKIVCFLNRVLSAYSPTPIPKTLEASIPTLVAMPQHLKPKDPTRKRRHHHKTQSCEERAAPHAHLLLDPRRIYLIPFADLLTAA